MKTSLPAAILLVFAAACGEKAPPPPPPPKPKVEALRPPEAPVAAPASGAALEAPKAAEVPKSETAKK